MSYAIYTVQLEILAFKHDLRNMAHVFGLAQEPQVHKWFKPFVKAASSMQIVSMFPIFLLTVAIIGFGVRFDISNMMICSVSLLVLSWTIIYVSPSIIEFAKIVDVANHDL